MVGTRHSLPNVKSINPDGDDMSVPKELRRLHIDGKDTMRGVKAKESKKKTEVYHWRGAVYEVDPSTRREWLDQDKRKALKAAAEERAETVRSNARKSLKRKSTSAVEGAADNSDDQDDDIMRPPKRMRRNTVNYASTNTNTNTTRQRKQSTTATSSRSCPAPTIADVDDTLRFDYSSANTRVMKSRIAAEKEAARDRGYNVEMYTEKEMRVAKRERDSRPPRPKRSTVGATLIRDIAKIAKLNTAIDVLQQEYEKVKESGVYDAIMARKNSRPEAGDVQEGADDEPEKELYEGEDKDSDDDEAEVVDLYDGVEVPTIENQPDTDDLAGDDLRLADIVDQVFDDRDTQSQMESQIADDPNDDDADTVDPLSLPAATIRDSQPPQSESDTSEDHSSKRQDSATNTTSPDLAPSSHTTEEGDGPATQPPDLPKNNRGGQRLRWSLGSEGPSGISKETRYSDGDRAEKLIHRGRLNGESAAARRRRVARELKFLNSWPIDLEESMKG